MDQDQINEAQWNDPANWSWGVYRSERDTRVWVPKPVRWTGWTLNFAHAAAVWWLIAFLAPGWMIAIWLIVQTSG